MQAIAKPDLRSAAFNEVKIGDITFVESVSRGAIKVRWIAIVNSTVLPKGRESQAQPIRADSRAAPKILGSRVPAGKSDSRKKGG